MENKLLTYILQMQKQSSTQSVPKLPKAQKGKTVFSLKDYASNINTISNDNISRKPAYVKDYEQKEAFDKQQKERQLKEVQERDFNNRSYISQDRSTPASRAADKQRAIDNYVAEAQRNSPLAQTFGSFTPSGYNPGAGSVAASQFVKTMPIIAAGAAGATALPSIMAGLNAPIAGVAGLTGTNLMNAGFAYQGAKNIPNVGRSIKTAYQNPSLSNVGNAALETGVTALDMMPFAAEAAPGVRAAINASKESGLLSNAWKVNPRAYQYNLPENVMYRGIGKEGMEDALQSGLFRAKQDVTPTSLGNFNTTRQFSKAYYSPRFDIADRYGQGFIAEVPREASGWGKRYVTKEWSQIAQKDIPVTEGKVLQKDWLQGYKEVPQPTSTQRVTRGPINYWEEPGFAKRNPNFNPEVYANSPVGNVSASRDIPEGMTPKLNWDTDINWAKWNPEIPKNEKLIEEYINIENSTKANNTWMKNPDGSEFKGTPEQFVQGQSENFKKAFPQGYDKVFRGDRTHYEAIRGKGEEFYGKPIFTTTNKKLAEGFAYKQHTTSPYYNANIETIEQKLQRMYGPDMTVEKLRIEHPEVAGRILETNDGGLYELAVPKTKNELSFNAGNRLHHSLSNPEVYDKLIKEGIIPHKRPELGIFDSDDIGKFIEKKGLDRATIKNVDEGVIGDVIIHNQRPGQYAKSLRGNNGMFDMTNPNIYKALIPAVGVAGIAGASQKKNGGPIIDPRGQWAHPGQVTRIPSANITMQGVPYPVLGVASNGQQVMMQPGQDYNFGDAEHVDEYPMMGNGGYTVTRSSDRKGKTHKVTGPGGVVKYFGDSKLGQHPKDPERKKAFYARHKSNLAGNPFFRAFARKTWEEGGQTDDDREMLSGVADMLRRVNDVNNRKQIANYMMDNFRDENVTFEPNKFLRSANAFGNNTPKAQTGREVKKKYVIPQNLVDFNNRLMAEDEATKKANLDAMRQYYINSGQPYFTENKSPREKAEPWTDPVLDRIDRENNEKYADRDSGFENFLEFIDPTGISSWDDVGRTFRNPSTSNMERGFALFSALPYVGKLGKLAKGTKAINTAVKGNALQKIGRGALKGVTKTVDVVTGGPAMRYFDQTLNPLSRGFGTLTEKAVGQIPYSGVRKAFEIGSDFNQMRRFQDGVLSPAFNQLDKYMTQPANSIKPWWQQ